MRGGENRWSTNVDTGEWRIVLTIDVDPHIFRIMSTKRMEVDRQCWSSKEREIQTGSGAIRSQSHIFRNPG